MNTSLPVARVTTPAEMVAVLPLQVGFTPTESLVVLCCHEPRGRMGLTLRIDLPHPQDEELFADEVEARVRHEHATRVVLAVYTTEPGDRPRLALVDDLRSRFRDLVVTEAALVRDGLFWSYLCDDSDCCAAEGTPVATAADAAGVQLLRSEGVLAGRQVLGGREELAASVAGPARSLAAAADRRCLDALDGYEQDLAAQGREATRQDALVRWRAALDLCLDPRSVIDDRECAFLAASLQDVLLRDDVLSWTTTDAPLLQRLFEQLCRATPGPWDVPVATGLAWVTYARGGGALVSIALERALTTDPGYRLARIVLQAWQGQLSPKQFKEISVEMRALSGGRLPASRVRRVSSTASSRARRRRPSRG